jgi:hypothetical protein
MALKINVTRNLIYLNQAEILLIVDVLMNMAVGAAMNMTDKS